MARLLHFHRWLIEAFNFLLDYTRCNLDKCLALRIDVGQVDDVSSRVGGISRSDGLSHLRDRNRNRLPSNSGLQLHHGGLEVWPKPSDVVNAPFMPMLVFFKGSDRVVGRMVINELMTLRAE